MPSNTPSGKYGPVPSFELDADTDLDDVKAIATYPRIRNGIRMRPVICAAALAALAATAPPTLTNRRAARPSEDRPGWYLAPAGCGGAPSVPLPEEEDDDAEGPRVAWLMSFPNSGTSYTNLLVRAASNRTTATNYGAEEGYLNGEGRTAPLRDDYPGGPFLPRGGLAIPEIGYVQTKSHCGGRCQFCPPSAYVETRDSFEARCLRSNGIGEGGERVRGSYSRSIVRRAVHLVRDPFDNVVSRYHNRVKKKMAGGNVTARDDGAAGFREHCASQDASAPKEERSSRFLPDDVVDLFRDVPCHAEFYRYAQWHNLAIETAERMGLPTLVLHYEGYESDLGGMAAALLKFLELEQVGAPPESSSGKRYQDYYTQEQRQAVGRLIRRVASPKAWSMIGRYLDTSTGG